MGVIVRYSSCCKFANIAGASGSSLKEDPVLLTAGEEDVGIVFVMRNYPSTQGGMLKIFWVPVI
jgi:hypothetical protein